MTFFATVVPVIMRTEHYSLTAIGLLQLVKIPWILKFLWAPLIDTSKGEISKYKKWIFSSEIVYAILIFSVAFLDIQVDFKLIIILLVFAFTASATQDIATDAFAYHILKKQERSFGSSIQTMGSFLGTVIGSGVLLIVYHYYGWNYLLYALAGFVLLALIPLSFYKQKQSHHKTSKSRVLPSDFLLFFKQKGSWKRIVMLLFFYSGLIGILTMIKPWLVDLGYTIKEIGIYSGIYGALSGVFAALIAGYLIKKIGKRKSLHIILIYAVLISLYFWKISIETPSYLALQLAIIGIWTAYSMATVFVYTTSMDEVKDGRAGTDFTIQIVLTHIGSLFLSVISGKIAHSLGYSGLFLIEMIIGLLLLGILPFLYKEQKQEDYEF
jgi:predicted MFS family arabinose efflux permease